MEGGLVVVVGVVVGGWVVVRGGGGVEEGWYPWLSLNEACSNDRQHRGVTCL